MKDLLVGLQNLPVGTADDLSDLDKITDDLEREATVGIIHNFGQTPKKIFNTPHPARLMHGVSSLPLGNLYGVEEDWRLLEQSDKPVRGEPLAGTGCNPVDCGL